MGNEGQFSEDLINFFKFLPKITLEIEDEAKYLDLDRLKGNNIYTIKQSIPNSFSIDIRKGMKAEKIRNIPGRSVFMISMTPSLW